VADVSYTPTFHHTVWVDRVDRVEAAGPNGFNVRFNAIESDLRQMSTVVTDIDTALKHSGPPPVPPPKGDQRFTVTPVLNPAQTGQAWGSDNDGTPFATLTPGFVRGVANIALPDHARLKTMRITAEFGGDATKDLPFDISVSLSRVALRLTDPPTAPDSLARAGFSGTTQLRGVFDFISKNVAESLALVDQDKFRYVLFATADAVVVEGPPSGFLTVKLRAIQFVHTFDR
jgi:hypothetical protein